MECDFRDAVAEAALNAGLSLSAAVDLVLTDPPYNSRRLAGKSNSEHDTFLGNDMRDAVEVISEVIAPGGHGILFTATRMFGDWCQYLECCPDSTENHSQGMERDVSSEEVDDDTERGEVDDESGTDEIKPTAPLTSMDKKRKRPTSTGSEPMFDVESVPLRFKRARGVYNQDPRVARLHHANVREEAVQFWRRGLPWNNMRAKVDYFNNETVLATLSGFPGFCTDTTNIARIPEEEIFYMTCAEKQAKAKREGLREPPLRISGQGRPSMWRPEQKSIATMEMIVSRFSKPNSLVVDLFAGTLDTAKACLSLFSHRRVVVCENDPDVLNASFPSLVAIFARQVLNPESDLATSTGACKGSCEAFLNAYGRDTSKRYSYGK